MIVYTPGQDGLLERSFDRDIVKHIDVLDAGHAANCTCSARVLKAEHDYKNGKTQKQIAHALGIGRARANQLIQRARSCNANAARGLSLTPIEAKYLIEVLSTPLFIKNRP